MSALARQPLPWRRPSVAVERELGDLVFTVTLGFDPETGLPREVFADGQKEGSAMQHLLADACVVISVALQHGIPAEALAKSLGRVPRWDVATGELVDGPASAIGVILEELTAREAVE